MTMGILHLNSLPSTMFILEKTGNHPECVHSLVSRFILTMCRSRECGENISLETGENGQN